uniref:Uncharacterized protein n=1 Tax=Calidris pygmaea TaxID=425635 RepID=A0A8C3JBH9_9CHAR
VGDPGRREAIATGLQGETLWGDGGPARVVPPTPSLTTSPAHPLTPVLHLSCPRTHVPCRDGTECVAQEYMCDGEKDCADGSDEDGCAQLCDTPGRSSLTECALRCDAATRCVPESWLCDGHADCLDHADEQGCGETQGLGAPPLAGLRLSLPFPQVMHPALRPVSPNPCVARGCSHLCLLSAGHAGQCRCPAGLTLAADETTCLPLRDSAFALLVSPAAVAQVPSSGAGP